MKFCSAFSLLEVLVAMSLLLLLLLVLVEGTKTLLQYWHHFYQEQEEVREASAVFQLLTSDLRNVVLVRETEATPSFFVLSTPADVREERTFFFLATLPREKRASTDFGDLCAVGYFVSSEQEQQKTVHHLYRFSLSCEETRSALEQEKLLELCKLTATPSNPLCERIASNITQFEMIPIWNNSENFSTQWQRDAPVLLEIVLNVETAATKNSPWRKVIELPSKVVSPECR